MKTVLNVGCGKAKIHSDFEGWEEVRLDIDPAVEPDIVMDMRDTPSAILFDAVYSSHTLEHLHYHEVAGVLKKFYRVLKPGGKIFIGVPNLRAIAWKVAQGNLEEVLYESSYGPIAAIDCIFGYREFTKTNPHQEHKTGFVPSTLKAKLEAAGFVNVKVRSNKIDMWASGVKK